jgi:phage terminase large subunit
MFVQDSYIKKLDALEEIDVDLYRVARLGRFGAIGTKVLPQIKILPYQEAMRKITSKQLYIKRIGMDFGFSTSYNAVVEMWIDNTDEYAQDLYIVWEYYKNQMTDNRTVIDLKGLRSSGDLIFADGAEPKTIAYFQQEGFNIVAASEAKSKGARVQNTKKVKRFRNIFIADNCINCINELEDLTIKLDSNTGDEIPGEFNIDPHTFSAIWYGLEGYEVADIKEALLDEHSIFKLNEVDFTGNYLW